MKHFQMSGDAVLEHLIDLLEAYLQEFANQRSKRKRRQFVEGERTAYVECLEIIQMWDSAAQHGLNWDIEARYPL